MKKNELIKKVEDHDEVLEILSESFNELQQSMHSNLVEMTSHLIESLTPKIREIVQKELKSEKERG